VDLTAEHAEQERRRRGDERRAREHHVEVHRPGRHSLSWRSTISRASEARADRARVGWLQRPANVAESAPAPNENAWIIPPARAASFRTGAGGVHRAVLQREPDPRQRRPGPSLREYDVPPTTGGGAALSGAGIADLEDVAVTSKAIEILTFTGELEVPDADLVAPCNSEGASWRVQRASPVAPGRCRDCEIDTAAATCPSR
jgi:hypothetical protein